MNEVQNWADKLKESVQHAFFGKPESIEKILVALLCRGHVLIEDVPGVGKTLLARAIALSVGGVFKQIQCTPDLLPADVLGVSIFNPATGDFTFREGPVMTNVLLVDEISRATPRTQSALLEAMAEGQVSIEGKSTPLPDPFFLIATESPVESEGTFPLPEVQKDRFFLSHSIGHPSREAELNIMHMQENPIDPITEIKPFSELQVLTEMQKQILDVHVEESLRKYILSIIRTTRDDKRLTLGVSPRGTLALYKGSQALAAIRGRDFVTPEDVQSLAEDILRKRIIIRSEQIAKGVTEEALINDVLSNVEVPPLKDAV